MTNVSPTHAQRRLQFARSTIDRTCDTVSSRSWLGSIARRAMSAVSTVPPNYGREIGIRLLEDSPDAIHLALRRFSILVSHLADASVASWPGRADVKRTAVMRRKRQPL